MINSLSKIDNVIAKIVEFSGMETNDKVEFYNNVFTSLMGNIVNDSNDIISPDIAQKLKSNPDLTTLKALLKEISESEGGRKIIEKNVFETVSGMIISVQDKFTEDQKDELIKILEN